MEKNQKKNIYIVYHFAVHLKLTQYCKSTILQLKKKIKPLYQPHYYFGLRLSKSPIWIQIAETPWCVPVLPDGRVYLLTSNFFLTHCTKMPTAHAAHRHPRQEAIEAPQPGTDSAPRPSALLPEEQFQRLSFLDLPSSSLCCLGNEVINLPCQYL